MPSEYIIFLIIIVTIQLYPIVSPNQQLLHRLQNDVIIKNKVCTG